MSDLSLVCQNPVLYNSWIFYILQQLVKPFTFVYLLKRRIVLCYSIKLLNPLIKPYKLTIHFACLSEYFYSFRVNVHCFNNFTGWQLLWRSALWFRKLVKWNETSQHWSYTQSVEELFNRWPSGYKFCQIFGWNYHFSAKKGPNFYTKIGKGLYFIKPITLKLPVLSLWETEN